MELHIIRLLKPLEFYKEKYGSAFYGVNKMYLLMEKQHNRGQDGAGFASIKLDTATWRALHKSSSFDSATAHSRYFRSN